MYYQHYKCAQNKEIHYVKGNMFKYPLFLNFLYCPQFGLQTDAFSQSYISQIKRKATQHSTP